MPATFTSRVLVPAVLALGATLLTTTAALAAPPNWHPQPGDDRATAHAGNVTRCAAAGLPGTTLTVAGLEDATNTFVTINADDIPTGDTLVAVVVKGGPGYNVYQGLSSWTGLHSPTNPGGQTPTISHWFACLVSSTKVTTTSTTTTSTTTTSTTTTSTTTTSAPTDTTTGLSGGTAPGDVTTTNSAVAAATAPTSGTKTLAYTGFGNGWLIWTGLLLLLAGLGAVAMPRWARRRG